jgi:iron complex outermembrane receptor protein
LPSGFSEKNQLQSFFGRANYNFSGRYFLTGTLRADGSSRFGADNRYGLFPSLSGAWQISEESFAQGIDVLSGLKLRVGWGQAGNQDIPNGITQQRINVNLRNGYPLNGGLAVPGITFVRIQNEDIRWEVSTQTNVGLDFALFENALSGTVEVFRDRTSDVLIETTTGVDPIAATSSFWRNYDMEIINRGLEIDLNYQDQFRSGFRFDVGGNVAFIDNEIQNMPVEQILTGSISGRGLSGERVQAYRNGLPVGAFWVFDFQGLDENGENIFRDVDGDGTITNGDRVFAGSALPDFTYGITTSFAFRSWDLLLNFNGVYGNEIYWNDQNALFNMPQLYAGNNIARAGFNPNESPTNAATASSRFIYDGSYFRLNNATLGYSFYFTDLPVSTLRLSLTGRNLFTLTDYPGFDPEVETPRPSGGFRSLGIDSSRYPSSRSITFTVNLSL